MQEQEQPGEPFAVTDPELVAFTQQVVVPAANQWAKSGNAATELAKRAEAKNILAKLQAIADEHGPDTIISIGRSDVTVARAIGIIKVGAVVGGFLGTPDPRFGNVKPETLVYAVAAPTGGSF